MTTSPAPSPPDASIEVLGQIGADRFCVSCGYNLIGQQIHREPQYGLAIARCPECGTVAAVGTHAASRWMALWRVILIALWLLLVLAAIPATGGVITGFSVESNEMAARRYSSTIHSAHDDAITAAEDAAARAAAAAVALGTGDDGTDPAEPDADQPAGDGAAPGPSSAADPAPAFSPGPNGTIIISPSGPIRTSTVSVATFSTWWNDVDPDAFLAERGGLGGVINREVGWFIGIALPLTLVPIGIVWAVLLLPHRRRRLVWWWLTIVAIGAGFVSIYFFQTINGEPAWSSQAARQQFAPTMVPIAFGACAVALGLGMWFGRPIVRGLVRAMLPPRLRPGMALLWRADGLDLPR